VLKSDYGAEGDEVVLGVTLTQEEWEKTLSLLRPGRWVAQQRFTPERSEAGESVNHGVFVIAGEAAGVYLRASVGATDAGALSVPALVRPS